ncbi:Mitochondrial citrate transporter B [Exophiala dermatitidis]
MVSSDGAPKSPLVSLIAGGAAGGVEATITYLGRSVYPESYHILLNCGIIADAVTAGRSELPFEFAKTRVQLHEDSPTRNPFKVIRQVIANEGPRALYKGCETLVAGTVAKDAIRFISFDSIKLAFKDPETGTLSPLRNLMAGITAGVVASTFAVTPTERIKTALIDDARHDKRFRSPWHATKTLIQEHGLLRALYRGYVTTTLKQASTTAVRLGTYNILKDWERLRNIPQTTATTFGNGAVAGTIVVFATQPFDTLKTRAQSVKGAGVVEAFTSVIKDYGVKGLWRGSTMRLGRTVLAGGILFTSYEWIAALIQPVLEKSKLVAPPQ